MINADGLLFIANFFCKEALWPNVQETEKAQSLISWLTGKGITFNEIESWLIQNKDVLNSFGISSFKDYQKENYKHYIVFNELVKGSYLQHTIITSDKSVSDDIFLEINKEGFLKGFKNIPNVYIFVAIDSDFKEEPGTKEEAKYKFLDPFFKEISSENLNEYELKHEKNSFIKNNTIILDKLISSFSSYPKLLGIGDDGAAYSISPNLVFKIFKNQFSYLKAKDSFERLHKNPDLGKNEAMIYDLGIIGSFNGQTIYYYIIEKMETLNVRMKNHLMPIVASIGNYIIRNKEKFKEVKKKLYDSKNNYKIKSYIDSESEIIKNYIYEYYSDQIENIESAEDLNPEWVKNLAEEILFKHLTDRNDLHLGNLGITNYGKFIYFDPSHEYWENNKEILNTPNRDSVDFLERDDVEPGTFENIINN